MVQASNIRITGITFEKCSDADANFDGVVNSLDFTAIASHFNESGHKWSEGDFDFNGIVNGLDFNALASNFAAVPGPLPGAGGRGR